MRYWLLKTEPNTYSWDDLKNEQNMTTTWEGVRNYQARNLIRDEIKEGDLAFFYHSVVKPMAIVGIVEIVRGAYPDHFALDPNHKYFDPKSRADKPTWYMMDVRAREDSVRPVTLTELKSHPILSQMRLLQKGSRLSVQPVTPMEWRYICDLSRLRKV